MIKMNSKSTFDKKIKKYCIDFIISGLKICEENKKKLSTNSESFPEFKTGKYLKTIQKDVTDYEYFVEKTIAKKLEELNDFDSLNLILSEQPIKKYFQNFYLQKGEEAPSDIENLTKSLPKKFLINYLKVKNDFIYDEKVFDNCFKDFLEFLSNYLVDEYIIPLYNFKSDLKNESLTFGKVILRPISEYEFKKISKLEKNTKISYLDSELTHVLSIIHPSEALVSGFNEVTSEFQLFLDALTLNFIGDLQLATIHQNINYSWKSYEIGKKIKNSLRNNLQFPKKNYNQLNSFYHTLKKSEINNNENLFVKMAIVRFQIALNRTSIVDKIIDYVTALESLYASGPGDITRKLSQRCCMVVGTTDEKHEYYHNFLKKAYNFRSGLVHGESDREIKIDEKILKAPEVCKLLEEITRESIKKYLKLINHYSGKNKNKKIIEEIDESIINRKKYTQFKKKF